MKSTRSTHVHDTRTSSIQVERVDILARTLHLVGQRKARDLTARQAVIQENRSSAKDVPPPSDAQLNLVSEIIRRLQGSMLTPEDRAAIIAIGEGNGLRRFDINLLIAKIQDRVRRAEPTSCTALVQTSRGPSKPATSRWNEELAHAARLAMALIASAALAMLAIEWLLG